jgi:hypothetical protein
LVSGFNWKLDRELKDAPLPEHVRQHILENRSKLAGIDVPQDIPAALASQINSAVHESFLSGFRLVLWLLVGLAAASSGFAWKMITEKPLRDRNG